MNLPGFDPLVSEWFGGRFAHVTEPQALGWPVIRDGKDVLISAPTGSGKTLAAFLICLDRLVSAARGGSLADRTEVVYVSPLKALSNDISRNLETPLAEIRALAAAQGIELPPIRTALRTGDTSASDRRRMLAERPHILITTPESLYILMTAERSRAGLTGVRTIIVDEIHAMADDKRGLHLALTIERLDQLVRSSGGSRPQRIGLSATVNPVDEVAGFLSPGAAVVDVGHRRAMDLAVEVPRDELGPVTSNEMWGEIYDRIAQMVEQHRTTLVFVNTRRLSERVTHHLSERLGPNAVTAHHGSLARHLRLDVEQRLKSGALRAVVATASLELGIDIGNVDLVCQIGSPRSLAISLQRIGRAGHWVGAIPKGRLFATTRDELIECAAIVSAIKKGVLDRLQIPRNALDILAQQIVAETACQEWGEQDLFDLVRRAYPYRSLERREFGSIVEMLSDGIATSRGRSGTFLHRDRVNGRLRARRGARLAAITSGGAIPDTAQYAVVAEPEGVTVGTLDEDFAVETLAGDIFLLGTTSWRVRRIETGRVRVEDAHGAAPTIPFWRGEAPGRTLELSQEVSRVREEIARRSTESAIEFLISECGLNRLGAEQADVYVRAGIAGLGVLPSETTVVAERFFDEAGGMQLVVHAPFGSRINRAWGLALRKRFCRSFNFELQAAATDNGLVISLSEQHAFPLEIIFGFVTPGNVEHVLSQALLAAPMFAARWRWNATRALAVLRFTGGRKVPPYILRMRSDDLLAAVFPDQAACAENLAGEPQIPNHPLVQETIGNCLHEAMDLGGLTELLERIANGEVRTVAVDTAEPSQFSHEIINANPYAYLDDAPLEERRTRAVQLRSTLRSDLSDGAGSLDEAAIAQVAADAWPVVRDSDELHDALLTLVTGPDDPLWREHLDTLIASRRATRLVTANAVLLVPAEHLQVAMAAHPQSSRDPWIPAFERPATGELSAETAAVLIVRGWLESSGPVSAAALAARLDLDLFTVNQAMAKLEAEGQVLRGRFTPGLPEKEVEWCNRRILARIHRLTLGALRRQIEPATAAEFMRFLVRWQHVAPGTQLHGADGLLQILQQLQGFELPAGCWESHILSKRVARYSPELLDRLCLSGEVMWGRLSPHAAAGNAENRRTRPTRAAPLSIFLREDAPWLLVGRGEPEALSVPAANTLAAIERRGALFFPELVRVTKYQPSDVENALWELVAAGCVTADGFENLRDLLDPARGREEGRRTARRRHAAGRWARLTVEERAADIESSARQLLRRWGVLFRDILARESNLFPWRDLLIVLRRFEARGEVRGGRFVAGFLGEQFALPEAVDLLRTVRRSDGAGEEVILSAADPLNLTGILLPGQRLSALTSATLLLRDGVPLEARQAASMG
jgi:ATP-dependent Lhr-like helicase